MESLTKNESVVAELEKVRETLSMLSFSFRFLLRISPEVSFEKYTGQAPVITEEVREAAKDITVVRFITSAADELQEEFFLQNTMNPSKEHDLEIFKNTVNFLKGAIAAGCKLESIKESIKTLDKVIKENS
ncbi:MAG: hypothetical protein ACYDDB_04095 [bacterium]